MGAFEATFLVISAVLFAIMVVAEPFVYNPKRK